MSESRGARRKRQALLGVGLGIPALAGLLFLAYLFVPQKLPRAFYEDSAEPALADAIIMLGGDERKRIPKATGLFDAGFAPCLLVTGSVWKPRTGPVPGQGSRRVLVETKASTTWENAVFSMEMLEESVGSPSRVLVVTDWWHTRRAVASFRRVAPETEFLGIAADPVNPQYFDEVAVRRRELLALLVYAVTHRIRPWS